MCDTERIYLQAMGLDQFSVPASFATPSSVRVNVRRTVSTRESRSAVTPAVAAHTTDHVRRRRDGRKNIGRPSDDAPSQKHDFPISRINLLGGGGENRTYVKSWRYEEKKNIVADTRVDLSRALHSRCTPFSQYRCNLKELSKYYVNLETRIVASKSAIEREWKFTIPSSPRFSRKKNVVRYTSFIHRLNAITLDAIYSLERIMQLLTTPQIIWKGIITLWRFHGIIIIRL